MIDVVEEDDLATIHQHRRQGFARFLRPFW